MLHVGDSVSPLPAIVALLKRGDIVTHVYASPPHGILDDRGVVLPEIREARRRGVLFDIGYGRLGHITWAVAQRALEQDFLPDTISTDLTAAGLTDRVFDFPTVLSNFLVLGLTLEQVIARATINAVRAIKSFNQLGTLKVGVPADVTVLELREGEFEFVDNDNAKRTGRQKLVPYAVVVGGKRFR
jgi:dihydroorotase